MVKIVLCRRMISPIRMEYLLWGAQFILDYVNKV